MKTKISSLLVTCLVTGLLLAACAKKEEEAAGDVDYYTCSMHPSVKSQDPKGKCPICGMSLVPVLKKSAQTNAPGTNASAPSEFMVPINRQLQIGVTYATVGKGPLRRSIRAVGTVTYDTQRHWDFVARVDGYVQKLHVSSPGELVEKDQPLMTVYSPDLLTAQREFVELIGMRDKAKKSSSQTGLDSAEKLIESARRRLVLWNITPEQIAELERSRAAKESLTLLSPFKGVVQQLFVGQGSRVVTGEHLVDVADLSTVWVWAEFYQDELPLIKKDALVTVTTSSLPGREFKGEIAVVDPFINEGTRTGRARLEVENPELKLQPRMYVDVTLEADLGEGLVVPATAVMPTGNRNIVFVDKGGGNLEPRFVELGMKFGTNYLVNSGLRESERVVNSGNFLIDAEAKVQGAVKLW